MTIFREKGGMTRRQFFKGSGLLLIAAVATGVFAKLGVDILKASDDYIAARAEGLYTLDEKMAIRRSHHNPEIAKIYQDFLSPGSVTPLTEKSEHLLHTRYGKDIPGLIKILSGHQAA